MSHKFQRGLFVLAAALVLFGALTATAYANLDSEPPDGIHGTTSSNPGAGEDYWWRQGWGQSLTPDFELAAPETMDYKVDGYIIGMLYSVDQVPHGYSSESPTSACTSVPLAAAAIIDTSTPDVYYRSAFGGTTNNTGPYGTNADNTIDILGVMFDPLNPTAILKPEGQWFLHYRYFSSLRYSEMVHTVAFGIDNTRPRSVTGVKLRTGLSSPTAWTGWQPSSRVHVTWDPDMYDALSKDGYYQVLIDDKPIIPEKKSSPVQGRVYSAPWLETPSSITVENMPPGEHKVSVVVVDRATNESLEGTSSFSTYKSDTDIPTVKFTAPSNGYLKDTTYISVDASDAAGPPTVNIELDGTNIATITAPPYRFKPNLTGVLPGAHVLKAIATDHMNNHATTTLAVSTLGAVVIASDGYIETDDEPLNTPLKWLTDTNIDDPLDADNFWRQGWGNSLSPAFDVTAPTPDSATLGFVTGLLYTVDRTESTAIDASVTTGYYKTARGSGTNLSQTVDLLGVYNYPLVGGWPASTLGGEVAPYEGYWYVHWLPFTSKAYVPLNTSTTRFGIDVTKPRQVTGLTASPSLNVSLAGEWTSASRANVRWTGDRYDDLSGVAYYKVLVDGAPVIASGSDAAQGRVYEVIGRTAPSVTIEDMPAGKHSISVVAVDRATNEGPPVSTYFYSDPDVPTITFGSFSRKVGVRPTFTVTASDQGGVKSVDYTLDGHHVGTQTSAPFSLTPDLSSFASGAHTLTATVTDMFGHPAQVETTISLDKINPVTSGNAATSWVTSSQLLTLSGSDDLSGVAATYYRINDGSVATYTAPVPVTAEGTTKVTYWSIDWAGNVEASRTATVRIDESKPVTVDNASHNWSARNQLVKLTPSDSVSGVATTRYQINGGPVIAYTAPIWVTAQGATKLTYWSVDVAGNVEAVQSATVRIDKTPLYITKFSRSPYIFYPIKHDGYYDNSTLKFRLSKAASVTLTVRTAKGSIIRTIKRSCGAGANSMKWDGKWSKDGKARTGTYTYQLTAKDSVGNHKTSVKLKTTIRNYQLVRRSGNRIKVIAR